MIPSSIVIVKDRGSDIELGGHRVCSLSSLRESYPLVPCYVNRIISKLIASICVSTIVLFSAGGSERVARKLRISGQEEQAFLLRLNEQQIVERVLMRERLQKLGRAMARREREKLPTDRDREGENGCRGNRALPDARKVQAVPFEPELPDRNRRKHKRSVHFLDSAALGFCQRVCCQARIGRYGCPAGASLAETEHPPAESWVVEVGWYVDRDVINPDLATRGHRSFKIHPGSLLRSNEFHKRTAVFRDDHPLAACRRRCGFGEPRFNLAYGQFQRRSSAPAHGTGPTNCGHCVTYALAEMRLARHERHANRCHSNRHCSGAPAPARVLSIRRNTA